MKRFFAMMIVSAVLTAIPLAASMAAGIVTGYDAGAFDRAMSRHAGWFMDNRNSPAGVAASPAQPGAQGPAVVGVVIPQRRSEIELGLSVVGAEAVYFATMQSGNNTIKTSGTITEGEGQSYTYQSDPADRLRVKFRSGQSLDYWIDAFRGDYSQPDGTRFLRKDHVFAYRLQTSWGTEASVALTRSGGAYRNTFEGRIAGGAGQYDVKSVTQGEVISDIDASSVDYHSRERVTGTVSSPEVDAAIDEYFRYHVVVFDNAIEDIEKTMAYSWRVGSDSYVLDGARIFRTFKNGVASELDSWQATGTLSRNGQALGGIGFEQTSLGIDTILQVDGQKTVLFSDRGL